MVLSYLHLSIEFSISSVRSILLYVNSYYAYTFVYILQLYLALIMIYRNYFNTANEFIYLFIYMHVISSSLKKYLNSVIGFSLELLSSAVVPYKRSVFTHLFATKVLYAGNIFLDTYKIIHTYNSAP